MGSNFGIRLPEAYEREEIRRRATKSSQSNKFEEKLEAQWAEPVLLTCHFVLRQLYTKPSIGASYQISINLAKWF
jgi:hypothetical protein